jgi:hypothetical protein
MLTPCIESPGNKPQGEESQEEIAQRVHNTNSELASPINIKV